MRPMTRAAPHGSGVVDKAFVAATARGHEYAGFDRVLIGYFSTAADGFQVAAFAAHSTERLGLMLAHRPGFVAPTLAARQLASLDQFSDGRLAVHIISGGSDADQARDGDFLEKAERYARTDDYLDVLRKAWTSPRPFDHDGAYYRVRGGTSAVRCLQQPHIPVYFGGSSDEAIEVAGKHADVYALWGESLAAVADTTLPASSPPPARHGREGQIRFTPFAAPHPRPDGRRGLGARPADPGRGQGAARCRSPPVASTSAGPGAAGPAPRTIRRTPGPSVCWPRRPRAPWSTSACGPELAAPHRRAGATRPRWWARRVQVCRRRRSTYWDLGVTTFLIRGFDPLEDALEYGRDLIPQVRAATAARASPRALGRA